MFNDDDCYMNVSQYRLQFAYFFFLSISKLPSTSQLEKAMCIQWDTLLIDKLISAFQMMKM